MKTILINMINKTFAKVSKSSRFGLILFLYNERTVNWTLGKNCTSTTATIFADNPKSGQITFQDPATPGMLGIVDLHHEIMFWVIFIVFFVFQLLIIEVYYFSYAIEESLSIKLRKKRLRFTSCSILETIWTIFPIYILWSIASPSLSLLYSMEEEKDPDLTVKITGRQWYWNYEVSDFLDFFYNLTDTPFNISFDSYLSQNEDVKGYLRLLDVDYSIFFPIRTEIRLIITSDDVIHSWTIPSFGVKVDAIPGRLNTSIIFVSRRGIFYGQCSELCGVGHGFMPITVVVAGRAAFFDWILKSSDFRHLVLYAHSIILDIPSLTQIYAEANDVLKPTVQKEGSVKVATEIFGAEAASTINNNNGIDSEIHESAPVTSEITATGNCPSFWEAISITFGPDFRNDKIDRAALKILLVDQFVLSPNEVYSAEEICHIKIRVLELSRHSIFKWPGIEPYEVTSSVRKDIIFSEMLCATRSWDEKGLAADMSNATDFEKALKAESIKNPNIAKDFMWKLSRGLNEDVNRKKK